MCKCFSLGHVVRLEGSQFPDQGMNPGHGAVKAPNPNHQATRELPCVCVIFVYSCKAVQLHMVFCTQHLL